MGARDPIASVVITTFNRADLIGRAIASALKQTAHNIEIIVVDDGSTDGTDSIVRSFGDPRLTYVRETINRGAVWAANRGVELARADLIANLDSDDEARPAWVEKLSAAMSESPDVGMAWPFKALHLATGETYAVVRSRPFRKGYPKSLVPIMTWWTPGWGGVMVRRAVFDQIGLCDADVSHMFDRDLPLRFAVSAKWTVRVVPEVLYDVHDHAGSHLASLSPGFISSLQRFIEKHESTLASYPRVHSMWLYRLARACYALGRDAEGDAWLWRAIKTWPLAGKPAAYWAAKKCGLEWAWNRAGQARQSFRTALTLRP